MASNERFSEIAEMLDMISQYICWEFTRVSISGNFFQKTDLLSFLKDVILKKAGKHEKAEFAKAEIVAKFIEELNCSITSNNFDPALQFVPLLNLIFPQLRDNLEDLLNSIEERCKKGNRRIADVESKLLSTIKDFSSKAFDLLPQPDLFKLYQCWQNNAEQVTANAEKVKQGSLGKHTTSGADKSKIPNVMATNNVNRMALKTENFDSNDEDDIFMDAVNNFDNLTDDSSDTDVSSGSEDYESDTTHHDVIRPEAHHSIHRVKSPSSCGESLLYCRDRQSWKELQNCRVVVKDIADFQCPRIQDNFAEERSVIKPRKPRNIIEKKSNSSSSEEDSIDSPPKKLLRSSQKKLTKSKDTSPEKRVLRKRLEDQEIKCEFCRRRFRSKVASQSHYCNPEDQQL